MYLRELSKAEAPEDRLLETTSFVAFTRDTGGWSAKSANCTRVGDRSDLPNSPFLKGCPLWRPKFRNGIEPVPP
jgi:hypothetical protein